MFENFGYGSVTQMPAKIEKKIIVQFQKMPRRSADVSAVKVLVQTQTRAIEKMKQTLIDEHGIGRKHLDDTIQSLIEAETNPIDLLEHGIHRTTGNGLHEYVNLLYLVMIIIIIS